MTQRKTSALIAALLLAASAVGTAHASNHMMQNDGKHAPAHNQKMKKDMMKKDMMDKDTMSQDMMKKNMMHKDAMGKDMMDKAAH